MHARTAEQLRIAVRSGAWTQADALLAELQREVEASWEAETDSERRRAIRDEVFDLLEWTRSMTLAGRAHTHSTLVRLSRQGAYAQPAARARLDLDA
jgi:hypothetical protein